jgi:hypothetical protein
MVQRSGAKTATGGEQDRKKAIGSGREGENDFLAEIAYRTAWVSATAEDVLLAGNCSAGKRGRLRDSGRD